MKKTFERKINIVLISAFVILALVIALAVVLSGKNEGEASPSSNNQKGTTITAYVPMTETTKAPEVSAREETVSIKIQPQTQAKKATKATKATEETAETETVEKTEPTTSPYATAVAQGEKASYQKQWDAGYLLALDYPDTGYSCPHVELSEENRELIEKVCYGEFRNGGFTGAALIAQSIKNAMVYYGTDNVKSIIGKLKYSGSHNSDATRAAKEAVIYVFDMDLNAVQHRILYKYAPGTPGTPSAFHESKEYVCTYRGVRFFDE